MEKYCLTCKTDADANGARELSNSHDCHVCTRCGDILYSGGDLVRYFAESFVWKGRTIDNYRSSNDPKDNELVGLWIDTTDKKTRFIQVRFDTIQRIIANPTKEFTTVCVCTKGHFNELVGAGEFRAVCVKQTGEIRTFHAERLTAKNYTPVANAKPRKQSKSKKFQITINEFTESGNQIRMIDIRYLLSLVVNGNCFRGLHTI